jgi:hypothetical protein
MPEAPTHFLELKTELIFFFSYMAEPFMASPQEYLIQPEKMA